MGFLKNMASLGMHVCDASCVGEAPEEYVWLKFEHTYPMVRFVEYMQLETDFGFHVAVYGDWLSFASADMNKVKRIISRIAKERGTDDTDWPEAEAMAALNKLSNILLYDMELDAVELDGCGCSTGLKASVAPENMYKLNVLSALLPQLIPTELGVTRISFENSTGGLVYDPLEGLTHDHDDGDSGIPPESV